MRIIENIFPWILISKNLSFIDKNISYYFEYVLYNNIGFEKCLFLYMFYI